MRGSRWSTRSPQRTKRKPALVAEFVRIIPPKGFKKLLTKATPQQAKIVAEGIVIDFSLLLERELKIAGPRRGPGRTGNMGRKWFARPQGTRIITGNTTDYAFHVERGTRPHVIQPRDKMVLAWRSGGRGAASSFAGGVTTNPDMFAAKVFHPGTKGQFIFRDTLKRTARRAEKIFGARAERSFARL